MICVESNPPEEFYYKGFLQICIKFTQKHPRKNITSVVNGRLILLNGVLLFHPYITSWAKTFQWLQEPDCFVEVNMYQRENKINIAKKIQRYRKDKIRCL